MRCQLAGAGILDTGPGAGPLVAVENAEAGQAVVEGAAAAMSGSRVWGCSGARRAEDGGKQIPFWREEGAGYPKGRRCNAWKAGKAWEAVSMHMQYAPLLQCHARVRNGARKLASWREYRGTAPPRVVAAVQLDAGNIAPVPLKG